MQIARTKSYRIILLTSRQKYLKAVIDLFVTPTLPLFLSFSFLSSANSSVSDFKQTRYTMPFPLDKRASLP